MRLLDQLDDLQLLRCGIPHMSFDHCPRTNGGQGLIPIRNNAFFEHAVFQGQVSNHLLEVTHLTAHLNNFIAAGFTLSITRQALLALLSVTRTGGVPSAVHEILRPAVILALGNAFSATQLRNRMFAPHAFQDNADLLFSGILTPCAAFHRFYVLLGTFGFFAHLHSLGQVR